MTPLTAGVGPNEAVCVGLGTSMGVSVAVGGTGVGGSGVSATG